MKSRISFFNKGVFRTDLSRFAAVWAIYFLIGILFLAADSFYIMDGTYPLGAVLADIPMLMLGANMYLAVAAAFSLFGDLNKSRMCNGLHAMPLRRETWFGSHFAAGMAFSLIPNTAFALILGLMAKADWYMAPLALLCATLQYLFFFGTALFCIQCAGRTSGAVLFYVGINYLGALLYWLVEMFYLPLLPGVAVDENLFLYICPAIQGYAEPIFDYSVSVGLTDVAEFKLYGMGNGFWYLLGVGIVGMVFTVLALVLYRRRNLETAGDFISAPWAKPVFLVGYTLFVGSVIYLFLGGFLLLLPLALAVGYITGQQILQRKFNVFNKKTFIGYGILTAVMALTLLITWVDPLGRVQWVPKEEKVASIGISSYMFDDFDGLVATESELQKEILELHKAIVEEKEEGIVFDTGLWDDEYYFDAVAIYLVYNMEDGTKIQRNYFLNPDSELGNRAKVFFSKPEYVLGYNDWETYLSELTKVQVNFSVLGPQQARGLLEAVKADCESGCWGYDGGWGDFITTMEIYDTGEPTYLTIYKNCANTIKWLNTNVPHWQDSDKFLAPGYTTG